MKEKNNLVLKFFILLSAIVFWSWSNKISSSD